MALVSELRGDLCIVTNALQKIRKEDALPVHEEEAAADVQQQLLAQQLESLSRRNSDTQLGEVQQLQQRITVTTTTNVPVEQLPHADPKIIISCDSDVSLKESDPSDVKQQKCLEFNDSTSLTKSKSSPSMVLPSKNQNETTNNKSITPTKSGINFSTENLNSHSNETKMNIEFDANHNIKPKSN